MKITGCFIKNICVNLAIHILNESQVIIIKTILPWHSLFKCFLKITLSYKTKYSGNKINEQNFKDKNPYYKYGHPNAYLNIHSVARS